MRLPLLLLAGLLLVPAAVPQDPAGADETTVLEDRMLEMQAAVKLLRRSVRDAEKAAESLGHLDVIQAAVVAAKREAPRMAAGVPEEQRAAFVAEYRRQMILMLQKTCELELAVLDGDTGRARALHKEIADMEDPGHEQFTEDG